MTNKTGSLFNLHGKIEIEIIGPKRYQEYFANEYARISTPEERAPTSRVTLEIVPRIEGDHAREVHYKELFRFRYAVVGLGTSSPRLLFEKHWLDHFYVTAVGAFIQGQLLEPIVYQKLLETGVLFMHAAGVSQDRNAFVFPAQGGTGKTTLSLALMRHGYDLMGDDLLLVDSTDLTVFPYARPLHLFTYNLKTLSVPLKLRAAIALKDVIRTVIAITTGKKFLISTRAHAEEILSTNRSQSAKLKKAVFLKRDGSSGVIDASTEEGRERIVDEIVASADLNLSLEEHFGMSEVTKRLERDVISAIFEKVGSLTYVNARAMQTDQDRLVFAREEL